jgi:beta-glucosidase
MSTKKLFTRRGFLSASGLVVASIQPAMLSAAATKKVATTSGVWPAGFLWGASTAGHQVEGSNVNSDIWALEHVTPTIFAESSGDACDQYQRYPEDIATLAKLGFNSYRFSLEWARIEPAEGEFLLAELEHYRRVIACCREHGIAPVVTFCHGTTPRWFAARGGFENPKSPELFARFCERASRHLGDLITVASTLNEPNIGLLLKWLGLPPALTQAQGAMLKAAATASGTDRFSTALAGDPTATLPQLLRAHALGFAAIKSGPGSFPVGVNLAIQDDQAVGADSQRDRKRAECYAPWLEAAAQSDYVGVQTYGRQRIGKDGPIAPDAGVELTQMGEEFYPEGLANAVRYAAAATKKPVYVTENGIATEDDTRRVEYIKRALAGLEHCIADGVDVRSYIHWSLIDNFEWLFGYRPKFGLIAVDRKTQIRTIKPSARYLGALALARGSRGPHAPVKQSPRKA